MNNFDKKNENLSADGTKGLMLDVLKNKTNGTFVEIGSNHPIAGNNTYLMESKFNWKGLMIEYDRSFEQLYKDLKNEKYDPINYNCEHFVNFAKGDYFVSKQPLNYLLPICFLDTISMTYYNKKLHYPID